MGPGSSCKWGEITPFNWGNWGCRNPTSKGPITPSDVKFSNHPVLVMNSCWAKLQCKNS